MTTKDILAGSYFLDNSHYQSLKITFLKNLENNVETVKENYANCKTNLERISCFEEYFEWEEPLDEGLERFCKTSQISSALRQMGNEFYKEKEISQALRCYNLSICFAPQNSSELALGFANRSALYVQMEEFQLGLMDVDLALSYGHLLDEKIIQKLTERKRKCADIENETGREEDFFGNRENQGKLFFEERFSKLKAPSTTLIGAEDSVGVAFDVDKGRRLIANKNIDAGTLIACDNPYTIVLDKLNFDTEHCFKCTKPLLGGLPDEETCFGLYCDNSCRSTKIPHLTSKLLNYIHMTSKLHDYLLPLSVIFNTLNFDLISNEKIPGFDNNQIYNPQSFTAVYNLVKHETRYTFGDEENCMEFDCILISKLVAHLTNYSNCKEVAPLLLHFSQNLPYNVLSLSEWKSDKIGPISQPIWEKTAKRLKINPTAKCFGCGVFVLIALCNNSCDPNAIFLKHSRLDNAVLISSRNIYKEDEITISYKSVFNRMGFQERREYLLKNYHFLCGCYACERKLGPNSICSEPRLRNNNKEISPEYGKLLLGISSEIEYAVQLVNTDRFSEAFDCLRKCARALGNLFVSEFDVNVMVGELMRRVLVHLGHL